LALLSQLAYPASQLGAHTPPVQAVVPWLLLQVTPQALQLLTVSSGASHPVELLLSQFP